MNETAAANGKELVAFDISDQSFCIHVTTVKEIRGWTSATPIPLSPLYVLGVINLRGSILPVVDLAVCLGFQSTEPTSRHAIIVVQIDTREVGLLVEGVSDIFTADGDEIQAPPDVGNQMAQEHIEGVISSDGKLISVLEISNILPRLDIPQSHALDEVF